MKAWTTATGARVVVIQGGTWRKVYCGPCAMRLFEMPADTGEVLEIQDLPRYPRELLEFQGVTRDLFDGKAAALPPEKD